MSYYKAMVTRNQTIPTYQNYTRKVKKKSDTISMAKLVAGNMVELKTVLEIISYSEMKYMELLSSPATKSMYE